MMATQPRDFMRDDPRAVLGFNKFTFVRRILAAGISPHATASCGAGFRSYSTHALQTDGPRNRNELYPGLRGESAIGLEETRICKVQLKRCLFMDSLISLELAAIHPHNIRLDGRRMFYETEQRS